MCGSAEMLEAYEVKGAERMMNGNLRGRLPLKSAIPHASQSGSELPWTDFGRVLCVNRDEVPCAG
jgi:hypothetical protein